MATGNRRAPYPYVVIADGFPLMLSGGKFKGEKIQPFSNITPTSQAYENWPAFKERTLAWAIMLGGFGHSLQLQNDPEKDGFYSYAILADLSIATIWQKGPLITRVTPVSTGSISGFAELTVAGTKQLLAIGGQYALKRTGDTAAGWPVSQNLGATAYRPEPIAQSAGSSTPYIIVGLTTGNPWRWDGTTWSQNVAALGKVFKLLPDTRELYAWTGSNSMAKVDLASDWWVIANWSASNNFQVGDATMSITDLAASTHGALVIVKQDGLYTLRDDGQSLDLFPGLKSGTDPNNGLGWWMFESATYVPTVNTGLLKLTPSGFYGTVLQAQEVGVEKIGDNSSPIRGRITAGEGTQFNAYAGIYNPDTDTSYLLKYGSRQPDGTFVPVWNGSISAAFPGVKITAMKRSTVGAPANHERLYLGFSDGSIGWFTLPCVMNPSGCSQYQFDTTDGFVYLPLAHLGFKTDTKVVEGASVWGPAIGGTNYAKVAVRMDPSGPYLDVGSPFTVPGGSRHDFTEPIQGQMADIQVTLTNTATTLSPQIAAVAIHHKVRPATVFDYEGVFDARNQAMLLDGRPNRRPPWQSKVAIENAVNAPFSTWITPDENTTVVSVHEYSFNLVRDPRTRRVGWLCPFKAVGYRVNTVYGEWARIQQNTWGTIQRNSWTLIEAM